MKILVIGGTKFVGKAIVESALAHGHDVTMLNRGQTNPDLFPSVTRLTGDREGDLSMLDGQTWDAVIDTCGYVPRVVRHSAEKLRDQVGLYCFISTISVYEQSTERYRDEDAAFDTMEDPTSEDVGKFYGPLKVLCEEVVNEVYGDRALNVRPGLIVGPYDPTNRFTYWVTRIADGGKVMVPGKYDQPVQFIDVRDLAEFTIHLIEQNITGTYNATGPDGGMPLGELFDTIKTVTGSSAEFVRVDEETLLAHEVGVFREVPLWLPADLANGILSLNVQRGITNGLTFRPLPETIQATLDWARGADYVQGPAGLSPEREQELLAAVD